MKDKFLLAVVLLAVSVPGIAQPPPVGEVPEPSSIALFAAGGLAIALVTKFKK
jgi:hypothetical protein